LQRTPPRSGEEYKSLSNSPIEKNEPKIEITRAYPADSNT